MSLLGVIVIIACKELDNGSAHTCLFFINLDYFLNKKLTKHIMQCVNIALYLFKSRTQPLHKAHVRGDKVKQC